MLSCRYENFRCPSSDVRIENYFFNYWANSAKIWHTCVNPKVSAAPEVWWCHVMSDAWRWRQVAPRAGKYVFPWVKMFEISHRGHISGFNLFFITWYYELSMAPNAGAYWRQMRMTLAKRVTTGFVHRGQNYTFSRQEDWVSTFLWHLAPKSPFIRQLAPNLKILFPNKKSSETVLIGQNRSFQFFFTNWSNIQLMNMIIGAKRWRPLTPNK